MPQPRPRGASGWSASWTSRWWAAPHWLKVAMASATSVDAGRWWAAWKGAYARYISMRDVLCGPREVLWAHACCCIRVSAVRASVAA